jgi:hypothetical protein
MDAEKLLSDLLNNELLVEMSKDLYRDLGIEEPIVSELTKKMTDRLDTEWYRKSNDLTHEKVHYKEG